MKLRTQRGERYEYVEEERGLSLFSVTQIRKVAYDTYAGIPEDVLEPARVRGTRLHRRFFFAMASLGGHCEYPKILNGIEGYCASMDRWIQRRKPRVHRLEFSSLNMRYGYAGTFDAAVWLMITRVSRKLSVEKLVLMDLKTGAPTKTDAMQLVAYDHMEGCKSDELMDLYLDADGRDAKEVFVSQGKRATEWAAFVNAINLLRWRTAQ